MPQSSNCGKGVPQELLAQAPADSLEQLAPKDYSVQYKTGGTLGGGAYQQTVHKKKA
jgi:beta-lactamase class A